MNKLLKGALICSAVVVGYGLLFHHLNVTPHDWRAVAMWLPVYISPIWGIVGFSYLMEEKQ